MLSAEAGATFPFSGDRYGESRNKKQIAAVEEHPTETVAAVEAKVDILDDYDFSTLDDHTVAALYEEMAQEDLLYEDQYEEDFLEGQ